MAYSYIQIPTDGTFLGPFQVPFPYIAKAHVEVRVEGELKVAGTHYFWPSDTAIEFLPGNEPTGVVDIRRNSKRDARLVNWQDGGGVTEALLDMADDQLMFIAQESIDSTDATVKADFDNTWEGQNRRIKNVADPVDPQDVVTKAHGDAVYGPAALQAAQAERVAAQAAAADALASQNAAAASEGVATAKEASAALSASQAAASASAANTSALNAAVSADDAEAARDAAADSADAAAQSESNAAASEASALTSANAASTSAAHAATARDDAEDHMVAAQGSASAAALSESNAADSAYTAQVAADTAVNRLASFRNKLINGGFTIWQRGASQTGNFYQSADRWFFNSGAGATKSVVRGTPLSAGPHRNLCKITFDGGSEAGGYVQFGQHIESVRTLSGKRVVVSFLARADQPLTVAVELRQGFGSGGSPTVFTTQQQPLSPDLQRHSLVFDVPSVAGKDIKTNDSLAVVFWLSAGSNYFAAAGITSQAGEIEITDIQIEEGDEATPFEERPVAIEWALCQRYFENMAGSMHLPPASDGGTTARRVFIPFKATKRAVPTVTVTLSPGSSHSISPYLGGFYVDTTATAGSSMAMTYYAADAEL